MLTGANLNRSALQNSRVSWRAPNPPEKNRFSVIVILNILSNATICPLVAHQEFEPDILLFTENIYEKEVSTTCISLPHNFWNKLNVSKSSYFNSANLWENDVYWFQWYFKYALVSHSQILLTHLLHTSRQII